VTATRLTRLLLPSLVLCAAFHAAAAPKSSSAPDGTFEGVLVAGAGIDNNRVTIRRPDGKHIEAWCVRVCDDWFETFGDNDEQRLKRAYVGKRVAVSLRTEPNDGRIAGPDERERLVFVKGIRVVAAPAGTVGLRN
jgi:hypothetical protein